ncbi:MAG: hypothetical protein CSB21_03535 [Deltaproteobacteria bacterium]|nr:MAG: hypothetical protein CSB21_03535 [Deltaproteobacteria bacterium]
MDLKFYKNKGMEAFSREEWEMICSGCGLCCLEKLIDEESNEIILTRVACKYLNLSDLRCMVYEKRLIKKKDCMKIDLSFLEKYKDCLPEICSYRILYITGELPHWHYLESGDRELVHKLGISALNNVVSGENIHPDDLQYFIW